MFVFVNALLRFCPSLSTYLSFKESKCNTLTARTCSIEILRSQKKNLNPPIVKILIGGEGWEIKKSAGRGATPLKFHFLYVFLRKMFAAKTRASYVPDLIKD